MYNFLVLVNKKQVFVRKMRYDKKYIDGAL